MSIVDQVRAVWKGLKGSERRFLQTGAMRAEDAGWRVRCKIIRNLVRAEKPSRIASILGCGRSQVYRVAERFIQAGVEGLVDRREDNGESKVNEDFEWLVLIAVATSPQEFGYERPTWTQELLVLVAAERTNIRVSVTTMSRLLARHRVRHGRPKPVVGCPWPKAQKTRRLNAIRRLRENLSAGEVLVYVDEVDIHLNPKIGNDWMLCGQQKQVGTPGKNEKRYLAGALNAHTGRLDYVEGARKTSSLFIDLIDHLTTGIYRRTRIIHVVLDNYRIHTSLAVQAAQARWGTRVQFHFLPPYCPDHNRIERLWKDLHDNVTRNHKCTTMQQLLQNVFAYLEQRRLFGCHGYIAA